MRNHEYGGSIVKSHPNSWQLGVQFPPLPLGARVSCTVFDADFLPDWEQLPLGDVITHLHLSANGEPKATFATGVEYKENKKERHFSEVLAYRMCYRLEIIVKFPTHFCQSWGQSGKQLSVLLGSTFAWKTLTFLSTDLCTIWVSRHWFSPLLIGIQSMASSPSFTNTLWKDWKRRQKLGRNPLPRTFLQRKS